MITRAVFTIDWHYPDVHKPTVKALLHFLGEEPVDIFIYGGDQHSNDCISHHNKGKPLFKPPGAFKRETDGFKQVMDQVEDRLRGQGTRMVWIDGNHERFTQDFVEEHPEFQGMMDRVKLYNLEDMGYEVVRLGGAFKYGKLSFVHGEWLSGYGNQAGMYPSKKLVEIVAGNAVAGHTHAPQSFTRISPVSQKDKWMGWISPIMGSTNPVYKRNAPTAWVNGFTIVEFMKNGTFNLFPVVVSKGKFAYGGKEYGA